MIDFYKKANFYFLVIPLAAAVWTVLASTVFLNSAQDAWGKIDEDFKKSQPLIAEIITLAPERIEMQQQKKKLGKFDYNTIVQGFADIHKIPESGYSLRSSAPVKRGGKPTQAASLTINNIKVEPFTKFLSEMLYVWPNLQCEKLTLTKQDTGPDAWKVQTQYKYTYTK